ncbi:MAG: hypothetical protein H0T88_02115 [Lysobacter sp.]|nr:hypothetical protein [Lysobacter sp.]
MIQATRAVLTIATGKWVYLNMAIALARSFLWWHRDSAIQFYIATDITGPLPADMDNIRILRFEPGALGRGFSMKLKLDQLAPADQTLFIDADCLCTGPLEPVFQRFAGHHVSVVGGSITDGEWFGDVATTRSHFGIEELPKFNGGVYYLERGEKASRVYSRARELEERYDSLGLVRLRGCANEELLMAISMALEGCRGIEDDGSIHGELFASPKLLEVDVLRGVARLSNPPLPDPAHRPGYPVREIAPVIVHFLGDFTTKWQYRAEERVLRLVSLRRLPAAIARTWVLVTYKDPAMRLEKFRDALRPLYRRLFGLREVRQSERV